ncbi:MFS transporter [Candidatus Woesearchaeota archaeon]|nr:MFS transporter [Candidatus Woesearchaeota archaeon]
MKNAGHKNLELEDKVKKSLKYSILDGTFAASMIGFGESFLATFAVFLKATNLQLGLLSALPQFLGSLSQLFTNRLIKVLGSRKRLVCAAAWLQGLMYIPVILVFFMGTFRVYHLIVFACVYWIFGMVLGPAWNSWMGDLVSEDKRGAYFGRRNKITGFASFVSFMIGGFLLQRFADGVMTQYIGFVIIFGLALISRVISFSYLIKKYEPKYKFVREADFTFLDFIKEARFRNFGLLAIYLCLMNFSVYLSAPFFTPYMLQDLKMGYAEFTIVLAAAMVVKNLMMPVWGKASDRFGTKKILSLAGFLMPLTPFFWLFSSNFWYLLLAQAYSGFAWAGFELASFNFIFDSTSPQKRATCVAYYNVLNGISVLSGAFIGSVLVRYNSIFWSKYLFVFFISFAVRYLISIIFLPRLKEVRSVRPIRYPKLFFNIITTMPTMGNIHHLITFTKHGPQEVSLLKRKIKKGLKIR